MLKDKISMYVKLILSNYKNFDIFKNIFKNMNLSVRNKKRIFGFLNLYVADTRKDTELWAYGAKRIITLKKKFCSQVCSQNVSEKKRLTL